MAESTLSITLSDIQQDVSYRLGYGRTYSALSSNDSDHVDDVIERGLRMFYFHPIRPVIPDLLSSHRWSFFEPWTTIVLWSTVTGTVSGTPSYSSPSSTVTATAAKFYSTMVGQTLTFDTSGTDYTIDGYTSSTVISVTGDASGETSGDTFTITASGDYRLPDDFGGVASDMVFDQALGWGPLKWTSPEVVEQERNARTTTGKPSIAAVKPVSTDGSGGQRWNLMVFYTPDQAYTMNYAYSVLPDAPIASTNEYLYGGAKFGEAIMAACRAACEMETTDRQGGHWAYFVAMLQAAINEDREASGVHTLGRMQRMEEIPYASRDWAQHNSNGTVVYDGVTY